MKLFSFFSTPEARPEIPQSTPDEAVIRKAPLIRGLCNLPDALHPIFRTDPYAGHVARLCERSGTAKSQAVEMPLAKVRLLSRKHNGYRHRD